MLRINESSLHYIFNHFLIKLHSYKMLIDYAWRSLCWYGITPIQKPLQFSRYMEGILNKSENQQEAKVANK